MRTTCLLALFLSAMPPALTKGDDPPLTMSAEEQEVVKLTNTQRKLAGVEELQPHVKLFQSARLTDTFWATCDLRFAELEETDLRGAHFYDTDLSGAEARQGRVHFTVTLT